jgi:hypothetical protein
MRKKAELVSREQTLFEDLWYARHTTMGMPLGTPADIVEAADASAARIAAARDPDYLDAITHDPYVVGKLHGELATVRWALGWALDREGMLDT